MADQERDRNASRHSTPKADRGDLTPPHGDELPASAGSDTRASGTEALNSARDEELRRESTFGRTDRYATQDDPDAERPVLDKGTLVSDEELKNDARQRRMDRLDDAASDEARMAIRKREHSAE